MSKGIEIQLFDGESALANLTGLEVAWFEEEAPGDFTEARSVKQNVSTDGSGFLKLNLDDCTWLNVGDWGFLIVYKPDETDYKDSPVFASRMQVATVTGGTIMPFGKDWIRPAGWLPLPDISAEDALVGVVIVNPLGENKLSFKCATVSAANYEVDWGDGSPVTSHANYAYANHEYDYADIDPTTDPAILEARACTFSDSGDLVNLTNHGFLNGQRIAFATINTTTGIVAYQGYYVVNATDDTFQVSPNRGGTPNLLTNDGAGSVYIESFRQVIVKITPSAGAALEELIMTDADPVFMGGEAIYRGLGWLDVWANVPSADYIDFDSNYYAGQTYNLASFRLSASSIQYFDGTFDDCVKLECVHELKSSLPILSANNTFNYCRSLRHLCNIDTSAATVVAGMLLGCSGLANVPKLDFSSAVTASSLFSDCKAVKKLWSDLSFPVAASVSSAFNGCSALESVRLHIPSATFLSNLFYNCSALQDATVIMSDGTVTNIGSAFYGCLALRTLDLQGELVLTTFPASAFAFCSSLERAPFMNLDAATGIGLNLFTNCRSLKYIPALNFDGATSLGTSAFGACRSVKWIDAYGMKATFTVPCDLNEAALNHLFSNLATVVGQTITVTGNPGAATCDTSIATAKGWTVIT